MRKDLKQAEFLASFDQFMSSRSMARSTRANYSVLRGALVRFGFCNGGALPSLGLFSADMVDAFARFYAAEPKEGIFVTRSHNTVCSIMRCLRTFFNWCVRRDLLCCNPFVRCSVSLVERYSTPYYLTLQERELVAGHCFPADSSLGVQRDIFIFQCLVGCRVSDLMNLTSDNIIGDCLEYVPLKTVASVGGTVVRVPLHPQAIRISMRYAGSDPHGRLLPFIDPQRYNYAIKAILRECGLVRTVTVQRRRSGELVRMPICDVASSHLARRTFIGNLYKKVKDPCLISSLTGHAEGSRAFSRYRTIDDDIKREIIMML